MRWQRWIGRWVVFLALVLLAGKTVPGEEPTWQVGIATAKITPKEPLWLAGYGGRNRPAEGTLHDLWIKVLALEAAGGARVVVVTSDLLGFPRAMSDRICEQLQKRCSLDRSQIMLTASHTHTGPVLQDALYDIYPLDDEQLALIQQYSRSLEETVAATVARALSEPTPATLWAGEGAADFAVNRRNNREPDVPKLRQQGEPLKGPFDQTVPVLAVRAPDGGLRAVVFSYACHATTLSFYQWSGDYPGFAQIALEEKHPQAVAMFHAGCGADQNPLPRRTVELCQQYGGMLAEAVEDVLTQSMRPVVPRLKTALEIIDLDYGEQPTREDLSAAVKKDSYHGRWGKRLLEQLDQRGPFPTSYPYPVQVWKLGDDQRWIVLGGEVVVDYSLRFKARYGPQTWVTGYANDVMAYIPSGRVWEEGGYESGAFYVYGLPALRWTSHIEQQIAGCVRRLVERLDGAELPEVPKAKQSGARQARPDSRVPAATRG